MAWTTPRTWADGYVVTGSDLNEQLRDNEAYLKTQTDSIGVMRASAKVGRGSFAAVVSPIVFQAADWDSTGTSMWNVSNPTRLVLPYVGYYQVSGFILGDSHASATKNISLSIIGNPFGNVALSYITGIAANKTFAANLSGICKVTAANQYVEFYCTNDDGTNVQSINQAYLAAGFLGT